MGLLLHSPDLWLLQNALSAPQRLVRDKVPGITQSSTFVSLLARWQGKRSRDLASFFLCRLGREWQVRKAVV